MHSSFADNPPVVPGADADAVSPPPRPFSEKVRLFIDACLPRPLAVTAPSWHLLPRLLLLAFILRAAVALSGDFIIHPDEIMQYLEPAHGLAFGNSILHWEYYYGARSYLVPYALAAILLICEFLGLGEPAYYIPAVKLTLCAFSLLIPFFMYHLGRRLFGECTGRIALLFGVFWYELVGFAHKSMTEFIATGLILALLTLVLRPHRLTPALAAAASVFAVFIVAVRLQYAPLVGLIWLIPFWYGCARTRALMVVSAAGTVVAVGVFDMLTWGSFLHPYWTVYNYNAAFDNYRDTPGLYIVWLMVLSGGLLLPALLAVAGSRERLFLLLLGLAVFIPHELQVHREYRYVFMLIPLWLLLCADFLASGVAGRRRVAIGTAIRHHSRRFIRHWTGAADADIGRWRRRVMWGWVGIASVAGIANALPGQTLPYETELHNNTYPYFSQFLRNQDKLFAMYLELAADPSVRGIKDSHGFYHTSGGYYYLHRQVPFYDSSVVLPTEEIEDYISHVVTRQFMTVEGAKISGDEDDSVYLETKTGEFIKVPTFISDAESRQLVYWRREEGTELVKGIVVNKFAIAAATDQYVLWRIPIPPVHTWADYTIYLGNEKQYNLLKEAFGTVSKPVIDIHTFELVNKDAPKPFSQDDE